MLKALCSSSTEANRGQSFAVLIAKVYTANGFAAQAAGIRPTFLQHVHKAKVADWLAKTSETHRAMTIAPLLRQIIVVRNGSNSSMAQ